MYNANEHSAIERSHDKDHVCPILTALSLTPASG